MATTHQPLLPGGVNELPPNSFDEDLAFSDHGGGTRSVRRTLFQDTPSITGNSAAVGVNEVHLLKNAVPIASEVNFTFGAISMLKIRDRLSNRDLSTTEVTLTHENGPMPACSDGELINFYSARMPNLHDIAWWVDKNRLVVCVESWAEVNLVSHLKNAHKKGVVDMYNTASVREWLHNIGLDPVLNCDLPLVDRSSPADDSDARVSAVPPTDDSCARASTPNADPGPFTPPEACGPRSCKRRRENRGESRIH